MATPTSGFLYSSDVLGASNLRNVASKTYSSHDVFEPSPLAAGENTNSSGFISAGKFVIGFNFILHVVTAIVTIVAACAHFTDNEAKKHLTQTHKEDFVSSWCMVMIVGEVLAVLFYVAWYGCVMRSFSNPIPAILGGGVFLAVFVCTLKLTYFLEIGGMKNADGDNVNSVMNNAYDGSGSAAAALYLQCFVLASIFFTGQSGTYLKVLQIEDSVVSPIREGA